MRTVVGVLRGGPSSEYDISLKSGATVLEHLDKEKYEPRDLFISKNGEWHLHGAPVTPERALRGVDVAFNTIHGQYGEDGQLHSILDAIGVAYTGPRADAAALAFDKQATKDLVIKHGVRVAHGAVIDSAKITDFHKTALNIFRSTPHPIIIKPVIGGSSVGMTKVGTFQDLEPALRTAFEVSPKALIEEFISGKEATVGVIDQFRSEKIYALMPVEIIPPQNADFFDYGAKYSGETIERVPGNFSREQKNELQRLAKLVHESMGLAHYSRSDFIVARRGVYFLEVNSGPAIGFTKESLFPKALTAVGATIPHFLDHVIQLARRRQIK